jgi:hypothetical protein
MAGARGNPSSAFCWKCQGVRLGHFSRSKSAWIFDKPGAANYSIPPNQLGSSRTLASGKTAEFPYEYRFIAYCNSIFKTMDGTMF